MLRSVPRFWKIYKMLKPVMQMPPRNTSKQHEISSIPNILNNGSLQRSKWKTPKGKNTCLHGREENHVFFLPTLYIYRLLLTFSYHTDDTQIYTHLPPNHPYGVLSHYMQEPLAKPILLSI